MILKKSTTHSSTDDYYLNPNRNSRFEFCYIKTDIYFNDYTNIKEIIINILNSFSHTQREDKISVLLFGRVNDLFDLLQLF